MSVPDDDLVALFRDPWGPVPAGTFWRHAPFVSWILDVVKPRGVVGAGAGWAATVELAVRGGMILEERVADLAVVDGPWEGTAPVVLVHGVNPGHARAAWLPRVALHLPDGDGLGVICGAGAPARLRELCASPPAGFAARCAALGERWTLRQREVALMREVEELRRRLARPAAPPATPPPAPPRRRLGGRSSVVDRRVALLRASALFDAAWYLWAHPDVAAAGVDAAQHFASVGAAEGRDVGPGFDVAWYRAHHPDVAAAGLHPLLHYLEHGAREGRAWRGEQVPDGADLPAETIFPVSVGVVVRDAPLAQVTRVLAAAEIALHGLGQTGSLLVADDGAAIDPGLVLPWTVVCLPAAPGDPRERLLTAAFAAGAEVHVALDAGLELDPGALVALLRMVRASERRALVVAPGCVAISRAVRDAVGAGFPDEARARAAGVKVHLCRVATALSGRPPRAR